MKKILLILSIAIMAAACSKKDDSKDTISLAVNQITLNYGEEFKIQATSNSPIAYSSEREFHALVSGSGFITAKYVGETNINMINKDDSKSLKVIVAPKYTTYPTPAFDFGLSKNNIISKFGQPGTNNANSVIYNNYSTKAPAIQYLFENDKVKAISVLVKTAYTEELAKFIGERYALVSLEDRLYINGLSAEDCSMVVGISLLDTSYWMAIYFPSDLTRSSSAANEIRSMLKDGFSTLNL